MTLENRFGVQKGAGAHSRLRNAGSAGFIGQGFQLNAQGHANQVSGPNATLKFVEKTDRRHTLFVDPRGSIASCLPMVRTSGGFRGAFIASRPKAAGRRAPKWQVPLVFLHVRWAASALSSSPSVQNVVVARECCLYNPL